MRRSSLDGPGRLVTNEGTTTLVNNTLVQRAITVPTNAFWLFEAGHVYNGDDVARAITVIKDDTANEGQRFVDAHSLAAVTLLNWPNVVGDNIAESKAYRFSMTQAHRIVITFAAGGASAGGTGRSMAQVREWIQE